MKSAVAFEMTKMGYEITDSTQTVIALVDYKTYPSSFMSGMWQQQANINFWDNQMDKYYGGVGSTYWSFESESIDSILLGLTLTALDGVPAFNSPEPGTE